MNDLISRAEALNIFGLSEKTRKYGGDHSGYDTIMLYEVQDALEALPSAEAVEAIHDIEWVWIRRDEYEDFLASAEAVQGKWDTGKPTKSGKYIVTLIGIGGYRFVSIMHYDKPFMPNREVSGECWYRDDDEWGDVVYDDNDILAWMPLPKPYREESEVKE